MLVLHIGYPKTSTTFLQKTIFPNIQGIKYLGRHYSGEFPSPELGLKFTLAKRFSAKSFWAELIAQGYDQNKINLYSSEIFLRPGYRSNLLNRLSQIREFDRIKIVVTIRNQSDLFASRFMHDQQMFQVPFDEFYKVLDYSGDLKCSFPLCVRRFSCCACASRAGKTISLPFHNYWVLKESLTSIVGAENVHFTIHEAMHDDLNLELNRLTSFIGSGEFSLYEYSSREQNAQRDTVKYGRFKEFYSSSGAKAKIFDYYCDSNASLGESIKVNLGQYGYH